MSEQFWVGLDRKKKIGSSAYNVNVGTANAGLFGASATGVSSSSAANGGFSAGNSNSFAQGGFRPVANVQTGGFSNSRPQYGGFGGFGGGYRPGFGGFGGGYRPGFGGFGRR